MAYEGTQIGADGKRYKEGEAPSDEEARAAIDQKTAEMNEQREKAKLNAASIGNREWAAAANQSDSTTDAPVEEPTDETATDETATDEEEEDSSEEDAEAAEKEEALKSVEDVEGDFPKHKGGGWFVLSDGTVVQGKEEAEKAEGEL